MQPADANMFAKAERRSETRGGGSACAALSADQQRLTYATHVRLLACREQAWDQSGISTAGVIVYRSVWQVCLHALMPCKC